ncbi:MAG: protein translocase subunit SecDF [Bacteroidetes bacterium]|jgi:SecD/SecF fusion protein|nr:protein translocase subunit SecDF [Bacteroidota bacterium]
MQGKGIIKFFLVVLTIVCAIQYMYLLPTRGVEKDAKEYAEEQAVGIEDELAYQEKFREARSRYLDSISDEVIVKVPLLKEFTYNELKSQQLALGLDLKGGMSVVLQVDLKTFLLTLADDNKDPDFRKALELASEQMSATQSDYITLFGEAFEEVAPDDKLARIFARNASLREDINFETSNSEVLNILRDRADETVDLTFKRLKDRIDKFGVTQPNVSLDAGRDLILVELPGVDNRERARSYLQATAKLEFWDVYRFNDDGIQQAFVAANEKLRKQQESTIEESEVEKQNAEAEETSVEASMDSLEGDASMDSLEGEDVVVDTTGDVSDIDELLADDTDDLEADLNAQIGPLFEKLTLNSITEQGITMPLSVMGTARDNQRDAVMDMLQRPDIKSLFPRDIGFRWSADPVRDFETGKLTKDYQLYALKMPRGPNKPPLEGDHITVARSNPDPTTGEVAVSISMDQEGARKWANMTTKAAQDNNREIAITLDDEVVSAPGVNQPIVSGDSQITGDFSIQEGQDLANILQIGKLPAETKIIQESVVGPSLGEENIRKSMYSLFIGFFLVLVFMILYYGGSGIVSILCLFANLFFIFGALSSYGTVLTLPGIAGVVLTIGMAVDANVIIFERIREELREGKGLKLAVSNGFKYSYSAIIDANVTTILVAIILAYFGLGPIKGFAVVLIIGVISTIITAVLFSRLVIDWWLAKDKNLTLQTGFSSGFFTDPKVDWLGKRKIAYVVSSVIIIAGIASFFARGFELGVDFKGGYSYNVQFAQEVEVDAQQLRENLSDIYGEEPVVKAVDTRNTYNITTSYGIDQSGDDIDNEVMSLLHQGINDLTKEELSYERFKQSDVSGTHITSFSKVGPIIAEDIVTSSYYATVFALILIFLYIFIRFSRWQYSMGAVSALFHDTLVLLGIFSLCHGWLPFSLEIDQAFIAALLTVIGYSINDTVVVFDRIREFGNTYTSRSKTEVVNMAINSTISRTVITSLTTLLVVTILFLFGGTSIKGFAFALVIGVIVGTYSSVFVASPIMSDLTPDLSGGRSSQSQKKASKTTV